VIPLGGLCTAIKRDAEAVAGEAARHSVTAPTSIAFARASLDAGGSIAFVGESIAVSAWEAWTNLDLPVTVTFRDEQVRKESTKNPLHALYISDAYICAMALLSKNCVI
jgi:hypothetical protein